MVERLSPFDITYLKALVSLRLDEILSDLPSRERRLLELRYGLDDHPPRTFKEVGKIFGFSEECARQLEKRALEKLEESGFKSEFLRLAKAWRVLKSEPVLLADLVGLIDPEDLEGIPMDLRKIFFKAMKELVSWFKGFEGQT